MKTERISIPLGANQIVVEKYNYDDGHPEMTVFIESRDGMPLQDICLVRPHVTDLDTEVTTNGSVDCIVWTDENSEDYTYKHVIPLYDLLLSDDEE